MGCLGVRGPSLLHDRCPSLDDHPLRGAQALRGWADQMPWESLMILVSMVPLPKNVSCLGFAVHSVDPGISSCPQDCHSYVTPSVGACHSVGPDWLWYQRKAEQQVSDSWGRPGAFLRGSNSSGFIWAERIFSVSRTGKIGCTPAVCSVVCVVGGGRVSSASPAASHFHEVGRELRLRSRWQHGGSSFPRRLWPQLWDLLPSSDSSPTPAGEHPRS